MQATAQQTLGAATRPCLRSRLRGCTKTEPFLCRKVRLAASLPVSFCRSLWYTYFAPGARALTPDQQDGVGEKPAAVAEELVFSNSMPTSWKNGALPRMSSRKKIADYFGITVEELMGTKKSPPGWASSTNRCRKLWRCLTAQRRSSATRWKRCCAPGQSRSESADKRQICFGRGFGQDGQSLGDHKLKSRGKRQIK